MTRRMRQSNSTGPNQNVAESESFSIFENEKEMIKGTTHPMSAVEWKEDRRLESRTSPLGWISITLHIKKSHTEIRCRRRVG